RSASRRRPSPGPTARPRRHPSLSSPESPPPLQRRSSILMKRTIIATAGIAVGALALAGCSSGGSSDDGVAEDGSLTLTMSGWSVETTPEFQLLADAYSEKNPDVTVKIVDYDPAEYNTLVTADLAAGKGPDII